MKKYFENTEYINLSHVSAMKLCSENPQFVMSRADWTGYHFVKNGRYYMLLKPFKYEDLRHAPINAILDCGPIDNEEELRKKVFNVDDTDWLVGYRSTVGQAAELDAVTMDYYLYHKLMDEGKIIYPVEEEIEENTEETEGGE